jgi:hypothetical protein
MLAPSRAAPCLGLLAFASCVGAGDPVADNQFAATTTTRYEQTDPAATYAGPWFSNSLSLHSGGSAALAMDPTSKVTFKFTGTGVSWIAYRDEWSGYASIYVDGAFVTRVDTYATPYQAQTVMYSVTGLTSASHTLTIEAVGQHDAASGGSWVWVDAFDVVTGSSGPPPPPPPAVTRIENDNPAVQYTATGWYVNYLSVHSGGSADLATDAGSTATLNFTGTGIRWIGYQDQWSGIAAVFLDGTLVSNVDTYSASDQAQVVLFAASGLTAGNHTIAVEATHTKNALAHERWVWIDAFDVLQ